MNPEGTAGTLLALATRGLLYVGLASLVGSGVLAGWVAPRLAGCVSGYLRLLAGTGAAGVALATLFVPVQVAHQLGYGLLELLPGYLTRTRQGSVLALRLVVLAALTGMGVTRLSARPVRRFAWACLALALIVTVGLTGHAGTRFDLTMAHVAHLAGVCTWGGTLLALAWFPEPKRDPDGRRAGERQERLQAGAMLEPMRKLSTMAGWVFPTLVLAGVYLGATLTGRWEGLLGSAYGRWLSLKVLVALLVAAAAATNRWRLLPATGAEGGHDHRTAERAAFWRLRRSVKVEAALLLAVLALTAFLSVQSPPGLTAG